MIQLTMINIVLRRIRRSKGAFSNTSLSAFPGRNSLQLGRNDPLFEQHSRVAAINAAGFKILRCY